MRRTKATAIPKEVKDEVWERDGWCVYCGEPFSLPNAHFIARSQGGLGVKENILTLCSACHRRYDQSPDRKAMREYFREYLKLKYPNWDESKLTYKRG